MEKTGFIYIWYDRKRKMFYIGCHWGTEHDGYICSSKRMRDVYRTRPQDFKRRIIQKNISRENLLQEEYKWLQLIPDRELGKQYYNHSKHHFGHWSSTENAPEIKQKCGSKHKGKKWRFIFFIQIFYNIGNTTPWVFPAPLQIALT